MLYDVSCDYSHMPLHHPINKEKEKKSKIKSRKIDKKKENQNKIQGFKYTIILR